MNHLEKLKATILKETWFVDNGRSFSTAPVLRIKHPEGTPSFCEFDTSHIRSGFAHTGQQIPESFDINSDIDRARIASASIDMFNALASAYDFIYSGACTKSPSDRSLVEKSIAAALSKAAGVNMEK